MLDSGVGYQTEHIAGELPVAAAVPVLSARAYRHYTYVVIGYTTVPVYSNLFGTQKYCQRYCSDHFLYKISLVILTARYTAEEVGAHTLSRLSAQKQRTRGYRAVLLLLLLLLLQLSPHRTHGSMYRSSDTQSHNTSPPPKQAVGRCSRNRHFSSRRGSFSLYCSANKQVYTYVLYCLHSMGDHTCRTQNQIRPIIGMGGCVIFGSIVGADYQNTVVVVELPS